MSTTDASARSHLQDKDDQTRDASLQIVRLEPAESILVIPELTVDESIVEVQSFWQSKDLEVWALDRYDEATYYSEKEILLNNPSGLINKLYNRLLDQLQSQDKIPFDSSEITVFRSFVVPGHYLLLGKHKKRLIIYVWAGIIEPRAQILSSEFIDNISGYRAKGFVSVPGWLYRLGQGSQFFANKESLFLMLINRYLMECSPEDHQCLLDGESYLKIEMRQQVFWSPPFVVAFLRKVETLSQRSQITLKRRGNSTLFCIFDALYRSSIWSVKKPNWTSRTPLTEADISPS